MAHFRAGRLFQEQIQGAKSSPDLSWVTKRYLSTGSTKSRMTLLNNIPLAKRQRYVRRNNASALPEGMHWTAKRVERAQLVQSYLRGLPDCPTRQEDGLLIWGDRLAVAGFLIMVLTKGPRKWPCPS